MGARAGRESYDQAGFVPDRQVVVNGQIVDIRGGFQGVVLGPPPGQSLAQPQAGVNHGNLPMATSGHSGFGIPSGGLTNDRQIIVDGQVVENTHGFAGAILSRPRELATIQPEPVPGPTGHTMRNLEEENRRLRQELACREQQLQQQERRYGETYDPGPPSYESRYR